MVRDLARGPDGAKLIHYMTQTSWGEQLGRQLEHTRQGRDFNQPTGRIYTLADLQRRLAESYRRQFEQAGAPAN